MKKKVLFLVMSICILMLAGGCTKKGVTGDIDKTAVENDADSDVDTAGTTDNDSTDTAGATVAPEDVVPPTIEDYVASEYVTLGQYKGVEVTVQQLTVTEENIAAAIKEKLAANATSNEITGRAVQDGDTVNIDYEGLLDGVAFDGGTAKAQELVIGSNSFIDGFETGLIGANIGDTVALNLTFPEDYGNTDLAGKAVVFNVKINSISESIIPELTDAYVVDNTDYDTVAAYKESIRTELETSNQNEMDNEKARKIMTTIIDNATIKSIPETLTNYYTVQLNNQIKSAAAAYGMEVEAYIQALGMTQEQFDAEFSKAVTDNATQDLIISAVAEAEKIEASEEDYNQLVADYMSAYGISTKDELLANVPEKELKRIALMKKTSDFIMNNAVVTN